MGCIIIGSILLVYLGWKLAGTICLIAGFLEYLARDRGEE